MVQVTVPPSEVAYEVVDVSDLGAMLLARSPKVLGATIEIAVPGTGPQRLPVRVLAAPRGDLTGVALVVAFHGGVNREKMKIPAFDGRFILSAPDRRETILLSIADPSLAMADDLAACFFAGNHLGDTPAQITAVIRSVAESIKPERIIFVGGSAGGHPALLQASRFEDSIAVLCNPLTNISIYYQPTVRRYYEICWPDLSIEEIESRIMTDASIVLGPRMAGKVLWLQNATDHHITNQTLPALARLNNPQKLMFLSTFLPGLVGHSFDPALWALWVRAAVEAPDASLVGIAGYFTTMQERIAAPAAGRGGKTKPADPRQINIADRIAAWVKEIRA
ncbi:hypothetical protein SAMN05519105_0151 [Rhodobacter sp. 24-YEA-8]|nr:hypothetical protein SAMN05519105_0151 [Rhodobacter sp. 24-YEA-8]